MTKSSQWAIEFASYSFVLAILYVVITLVCVFQLARILYFRHNLLHYQFGFLLYTLVWTLLRGLFWMFLPWKSEIELVLQGTAILLQFSTFTFLVLFYVQMIHKGRGEWSGMRTRSVGLFAAVNFLFLLAFLVTIIFAHYYGPEDVLGGAVHAYFVAAMYLLLSAGLAYFGWRLMYLVGSQNIRIPFLKSRLQISVLTVTLFFVFISRGVKDFLSGLGIAQWKGDPAEQALTTQALLFSVYAFWEIVPAFLVILFFWHIPGSRSNESSRAARPVPYYGAINSEESRLPSRDGARPSRVFDNPGRYDSDDELGPARPKAGRDAFTPASQASSPAPGASAGGIQGEALPPAALHAQGRRFGGYNTRSPLLEKQMGSPWNETS